MKHFLKYSIAFSFHKKYNIPMNEIAIIKIFMSGSGMTVDEFVKAAKLKSRTPYYCLMSGSGYSLTAVDKMLRVCGYCLGPMPISEVETPNEHESRG